MKNVTAIILGGGRGTRLYPLTLERSKPAVAFAGKYRLIDIPISNCINSGLKKVFVLTQFLSASMHRHIMRTYRFDKFTEGFVDILAAEQTPDRADWFQGTADAVRATLNHTTVLRFEAGAHPLGGPPLPHGLLGPGALPPGERGRHHAGRLSGGARGGVPAGPAEGGRRRPRQRVRREAQGPGGDRPLRRAGRAVRPSRLEGGGPALPGLHGHLRVRGRGHEAPAGGPGPHRLRRRRDPRRHRGLQGDGLPLHRLLAGHRDHRRVLRGQPRPGRSRTPSSTCTPPAGPSTPAPAPCRPAASWARRSTTAWWPRAPASPGP